MLSKHATIYNNKHNNSNYIQNSQINNWKLNEITFQPKLQVRKSYISTKLMTQRSNVE